MQDARQGHHRAIQSSIHRIFLNRVDSAFNVFGKNDTSARTNLKFNLPQWVFPPGETSVLTLFSFS